MTRKAKAKATKVVPLSVLREQADALTSAREQADRAVERLWYLHRWASSRRGTEDFCRHIAAIRDDVARIVGGLEVPMIASRELAERPPAKW